MNKIITVTVVFLLGVMSGIVFPSLWERVTNSQSEYVTASVIRSVGEFMVENHRWPKSWDDLGIPNQDEHVRINFSLVISRADRLDVFNAINTKSGKWLTYPHRVSDMEALGNKAIKLEGRQ
jgi:hypothetical protein